MKKFILLIVCCLAVSGVARAQESPEEELQVVESKFILPIDYANIKRLTADAAMYAKLVAQFEAADQSMGMYDISLLYYGWVFKPGYKGNLDAEQSPVERLFSEGEFERAWNEGSAYLKDNPVSLITLQFTLAAGNAIGKPAEELERLSWRYGILLRTIYHTGDGYTEQGAYKVISNTDKFIFMDRLLGVEDYANRYLTPTLVDRYDVVKAKNFDRRFLFIDASLAAHLGPKPAPTAEIPAEASVEQQ